MISFMEHALETTKEIKNDRTMQDILTHLVTEVGELAQEIQIADGKSYKKHGADGVVGEAIDVIACAIDIITKYNSDIDEDMLTYILVKKLQKWKDTVNDSDN